MLVFCSLVRNSVVLAKLRERYQRNDHKDEQRNFGKIARREEWRKKTKIHCWMKAWQGKD